VAPSGGDEIAGDEMAADEIAADDMAAGEMAGDEHALSSGAREYAGVAWSPLARREKWHSHA
jgi:hypothetical protein